MQLLEISLKLLSPTILTRESRERGYYKPLSYVPQSTLRGALLTSLYKKEIIDEVFLRGEMMKPTIRVSPAYPIEDTKSYPAHPFIYECKIDKEICNYAREIIKLVDRGRPINFRLKCSSGHPALEILHPKLVKVSGSSINEIILNTHESICVSISKRRASSQKEMLFRYEAIAEGTRFWAYLSVPEDLYDVFKPGLELSLGRGTTRGFGRAEIQQVSKIELEDEIDKIKDCLNGRQVVFYALSNLLSISENTSSPFPLELDLRVVGTEINRNVNGKLVVSEVYGKTTLFHCGWDIQKNIERPSLTSGSAGSILIGRIEGGREVLEALAILGLIGTVEYGQGFCVVGANIITPLKGHVLEGNV